MGFDCSTIESNPEILDSEETVQVCNLFCQLYCDWSMSYTEYC